MRRRSRRGRSTEATEEVLWKSGSIIGPVIYEMEAIRSAWAEKEGCIWIGEFDPGDRRQKRVETGNAAFC